MVDHINFTGRYACPTIRTRASSCGKTPSKGTTTLTARYYYSTILLDIFNNNHGEFDGISFASSLLTL